MAAWTRYSIMAALAMAVGLAGCSKKEPPPVQYAPDTSAYDQQIRDLEDALRQAQADRDANRDRLARLQQELDDLRRKLAQTPEPPPPPDWKAVEGGAMTSIEGTVLFDSGKAILKPGAQETLSSIARVINERYPDYDIYVFGHTDNEPIRFSPWKDNLELSAQRALTVTRSLRDMTGSTNIAAGGWGAYRPVAENTTAEGRQANRRVEIYAMRPQEGAAPGQSNPPRGNSREIP